MRIAGEESQRRTKNDGGEGTRSNVNYHSKKRGKREGKRHGPAAPNSGGGERLGACARDRTAQAAYEGVTSSIPPQQISRNGRERKAKSMANARTAGGRKGE